ncbi:MAG TPA: methyltransferase domain-containing protein [Vicinamibacterales bacterium]
MEIKPGVVSEQRVIACSVRGCNLPLERRGGAFACPRGHSYDVSRSGYVNLLQPQDRRSPDAGDRRTAVEARTRLLAAGVGRAIIDAVVRRAAALELDDGAAVVDIGSGSGETLASLARERAITGIGIDLSTAAAHSAARRFPHLTWVVANADRRLPLVDRSISLVLSVHARRHAVECARVLAPGGRLIVAVPAPDDLIELRESLMGKRMERDRASTLLAEHEPLFTLIDRGSARERQHLDREPLLDLLHTTYRGARTSGADRIAALQRLEVTLATDWFLFRAR